MKKKHNLPTFMLAHNPMVESGMHLVHTREPLFIAKIVHFRDQVDALDYESGLRLMGRTIYKDEYYILDIQLLIRTTAPPDEAQKDADNLAKLFRRAADWLHAALKNMEVKDGTI